MAYPEYSGRPPYSRIVQNIFPSKEQDIIINAIEETKLSDYVTTIANIIDPKNILFARIYFSSTNIVDGLVANLSNIKFNGRTLNIRLLITPTRRIIWTFGELCGAAAV